MKIVSMTMVGNENEIIESFVRYTCQFVDEMWIISCCSVDNTLKIIRKLIGEGLPIRLFIDEEYHISYNQKYIDNKYLKKIALEEGVNWVIPLDADEFLWANGNPRSVIENLDQNYIYEAFWKNYAMADANMQEELFIPKKLQNFKQGFDGNQITKVLIPARHITDKKIILATGHHHAYGEEIQTKVIDILGFAHYPCVNEEQYKLKINGNSISFIAWSNRGNDEGAHINKQRTKIKQGCIREAANEYGLDQYENIQLICDPLNISWCDKGALEIRYGDLAKTEYENTIIKIGQLMALKAYIYERQMSQREHLPLVLVYGTGKSAETLFNGLPENIVHILAYVDSDPDREFAMFQKRLIIGPEWVRFFKYDKIIISTPKFYDEIRNILLEYGVSENKISGQGYLFDLEESPPQS